METTLFYARAACDTMMRKFAAADLPPKGHFYYHQGVFLSGVLKTWQLTGEQKYLDYAASWVHAVFDESGKVKQYKRADLDDIQAGILLYTLYDATGDKFYRRCIESVAAQVQDIPRCQCGGFWHTCGSSNQMWLDGLYMACPFIAEYARRFDRPEWTDLVVNEIRLMREHTRDAKTGLWYHAWDESRKADWGNPETGLAPEFWGRSIGWVPVAIQDVLEQMDLDDERRAALELYVRDLLTSLLRYQSADGRWYQVVNKGDQPGNWFSFMLVSVCLFPVNLCKPEISDE